MDMLNAVRLTEKGQAVPEITLIRKHCPTEYIEVNETGTNFLCKSQDCYRCWKQEYKEDK